MKGNQVILLFFFLTASLLSAHSFAGDAEKKAVKAAESWLGLVDAGEYAKSWDQSSELFRNAITKEKWEQSLHAARRPFGALVSRKVKSTQYATALPGAPDGEYVVIQFTTTFENKKSAVETITPMKDPDGRWRVSGYYIK